MLVHTFLHYYAVLAGPPGGNGMADDQGATPINCGYGVERLLFRHEVMAAVQAATVQTPPEIGGAAAEAVAP